MASRSPTLRASTDPFGPDAEKHAEPFDDVTLKDGAGQPDVEADAAAAKRRSSGGSAFRRRSTDPNADPFGEVEEGDVKYRTLKWW